MGTRIRLNSLLDDAKNALETEQKESAPPAAPEQAEQAEQQPARGTPPQPNPAEADTPPLPAADSPAPAKPTAPAARRSSARRGAADAPSSERVHYSSLVRKEARLRDDQIESLTLRARKLSRNKTASDQRITDNTLIRVAVDLLLAREADLNGTSEAELRKSVGL